MFDDFIYRKAFAECVERIFYQIHTVGVIDYVFIDCIGDCKRGFIVASCLHIQLQAFNGVLPRGKHRTVMVRTA